MSQTWKDILDLPNRLFWVLSYPFFTGLFQPFEKQIVKLDPQ